jgi:hypothetical protein
MAYNYADVSLQQSLIVVSSINIWHLMFNKCLVHTLYEGTGLARHEYETGLTWKSSHNSRGMKNQMRINMEIFPCKHITERTLSKWWGASLMSAVPNVIGCFLWTAGRTKRLRYNKEIKVEKSVYIHRTKTGWSVFTLWSECSISISHTSWLALLIW